MRLFRKTPYLVWAHGSEIVDDWRTPRRVMKSCLRPLKKLILEHSAGIVANSRYTETLVLKQGGYPRDSSKLSHQRSTWIAWLSDSSP